MSGQHGAGLVKCLWNTINKCFKKMRKNGKEKLESLRSVLTKVEKLFKIELIQKDGIKLNI